MARNRGLKELCDKIEYILFLDHDDELLPGAVEQLVDGIQGSRGVVGAHGLAMGIDAHGDYVELPTDGWFSPEKLRERSRELCISVDSSRIIFATLLLGCPVVTVGQVMIVRKHLDVVGGFDPTVVPADDWDMWLRLAMLGDLVDLGVHTIKYRVHSANVSRDAQRMSAAAETVIRKLEASPNLDASRHRLVLRGGLLRNRVLVRCRIRWAAEAFERAQWISGSKHLWHGILNARQCLRYRNRLA